MQGAPTVGLCGGVGNAQKTACFGCLGRCRFVCSFLHHEKLLGRLLGVGWPVFDVVSSFLFGLELLEGVVKLAAI